ncbi:Bug family tripartite tricarboxylate transporter substrate binding protein [Sphaerotilus microaerophilus]|uniref:ABC transporter substrate-binding protein n=1 Tax=Sphaerotilus microaerophilus TaxID=2914710 RepID=A0ABM7YHF8_9BURK|nr:Bug family tripartite tricarboxylate transporter substrate binding protein [Sphaerotilus sp. FB-5]BDI03614.1 ABC transporter substrate-binding protein [Sphaerotilus sp. FB-5]
MTCTTPRHLPRSTATRRRLLASAALAAAAIATPFSGALAADAKAPYKLLVGFPAGGGTDAIARLLAEKLKDELGAPVIVENKPGAGGQLAAQALKAAPADGHTLFLSHDHTITILPMVVKTPGYDSAKDFVPVAGFATFVNALAVSGGTPAKGFNDYVGWLRTNVDGKGGGKGSVGIPAPASTPEFLVKVIGEKYKLDLVPVPYRGSAPMMADMLGNQIAAGVGSVPDFIENHKAGKVRVVAVLGGARQAVLPDVPTFAELGLAGLEDMPYYGVFAPVGTPRAKIDEFGAALAKVIAQRDVHERLTTMGLTVGFMTSQQLATREQAYAQVWARIIKASGFQPQ